MRRAHTRMKLIRVVLHRESDSPRYVHVNRMLKSHYQLIISLRRFIVDVDFLWFLNSEPFLLAVSTLNSRICHSIYDVNETTC